MALRKVSFICDQRVSVQLNKLEQVRNRCEMVQELVYAYGLYSKMKILKMTPAMEEDLLSFHSRHYIEYLQSMNEVEEDDLEDNEDDQAEFGLGYDCPPICDIYDFVTSVAGSSLTAAKSLCEEAGVSAAINWYGGWHHCQRDEAEGFCYVNDVVCAIHELRRKFDRVLYIDLDIHHGNGVENAFAFTKKVLTLSIHKYEPGFYPGSGGVEDVGFGTGRYYTVNVPLKDGIRDNPYIAVFDRVANMVVRIFKPDAVVVQCGADSLTGDPLGTFNLTLKGLGHCVQRILSWNRPSLFLGGGGYNIVNTSRLWTYLTSLIVGCDISLDIPDNSSFFTCYGPGFELDISPSYRPDSNTKEYLEDVIQTISKNLQNIAST